MRTHKSIFFDPPKIGPKSTLRKYLRSSGWKPRSTSPIGCFPSLDFDTAPLGWLTASLNFFTIPSFSCNVIEVHGKVNMVIAFLISSFFKKSTQEDQDQLRLAFKLGDEDSVNEILLKNPICVRRRGKIPDRWKDALLRFYNKYAKNISHIETDSINWEKVKTVFSSAAQKAKENDTFCLQLLPAGQANCSILCQEQKDKARKAIGIFDLGIEEKTTKKMIYNVLNYSSEVRFVLISHYDFDHISAFPRVARNLKKCQWLAPIPSKKYPTLATVQMVNQLSKFANVCFIPNDCLLLPITLHIGPGTTLTILQGHQTRVSKRYKWTNSAENAHCLISFLQGPHGSILLPGDALYANFPVPFSPTFLVVPHHGCFYDGSINKKLFSNLQESFVFSYITTSKPRYPHPNKQHLKTLIGPSVKHPRPVYRFQNEQANNWVFSGIAKAKQIDKLTTKIAGETKKWVL